MNADKALNTVLLTLYQQYNTDAAVREFGMFPWNLTEASGLAVEDAGDSLVICQRLVDRGWVRVISRKRGGRELQPWDSITITEAGIDQAEELLKSSGFRFLKKVYTATIEGIVRGLKD